MIDEIAAAKIDGKTPCRYQVYRPSEITSARSRPRQKSGRLWLRISLVGGVCDIGGCMQVPGYIYHTILHAMNTTIQ